jgi:hypothetical protein
MLCNAGFGQGCMKLSRMGGVAETLIDKRTTSDEKEGYIQSRARTFPSCFDVSYSSECSLPHLEVSCNSLSRLPLLQKFALGNSNQYIIPNPKMDPAEISCGKPRVHTHALGLNSQSPID